MPVDAASNEHLKKVFRAYCKLRVGQGRQVGASIQHINAAQFHQMCRDAGLLDPTGEHCRHTAQTGIFLYVHCNRQHQDKALALHTRKRTAMHVQVTQ